MKDNELNDRLVIEDIASLVDRAVDDKQWDDMAGHFSDPVLVDIGAIGGSEAVELPKADFVQGIVAVNPLDKRTYHSRSNVITRVTGDRATMSAHSYGWNDCARFDPSVYEVWGKMDYDFVRIDSLWLIIAVRMQKWREAGNCEVNAYRS